MYLPCGKQARPRGYEESPRDYKKCRCEGAEAKVASKRLVADLFTIVR